MRSEELTLRTPHCLNLRAALARGMRRLDAGGEAPLPIRAAARLPKTAPVGRFVPSGYCDAAKNLLGSRTKSAEEILITKITKNTKIHQCSLFPLFYLYYAFFPRLFLSLPPLTKRRDSR